MGGFGGLGKLLPNVGTSEAEKKKNPLYAGTGDTAPPREPNPGS